MSNETNLSKKFKSFAGRSVVVAEVSHTYVRDGKKHCLTTINVDANDPTIAALTAAAKKIGLELRLHVPGMMSTADYRLDRLNATLERAEGGGFRLGSQFHLG